MINEFARFVLFSILSAIPGATITPTSTVPIDNTSASSTYIQSDTSINDVWVKPEFVDYPVPPPPSSSPVEPASSISSLLPMPLSSSRSELLFGPPENVFAIPTSGEQVKILWTPVGSSDTLRGYALFRNDEQIDITKDTIYINNGLSRNTDYCYSIASLDLLGRYSQRSNRICVNTIAPEPASLIGGVVSNSKSLGLSGNGLFAASGLSSIGQTSSGNQSTGISGHAVGGGGISPVVLGGGGSIILGGGGSGGGNSNQIDSGNSNVNPPVEDLEPGALEGWYVSVNGKSDGDGSATNPWDLQTALSDNTKQDSPNNSIKSGDTVWLRGGRYNGEFSSYLKGENGKHIIVRQYPRERAVLSNDDDEGGQSALSIYGSYTIYQDFEVARSKIDRTSSRIGSWPDDINAGVAVSAMNTGAGNKIVNLVIHDNYGGIFHGSGSSDLEIYGNLIYYNGWDAPDRRHGHGLYAQNKAPSVLTVSDNIFFGNADHGAQFYGTGNSSLDNLHMIGNVFWGNGELFGGELGGRNLLVGGGAPLRNSLISENFLYRKETSPGSYPNTSDFYYGYNGIGNGGTISGNYIVGTSRWDGSQINIKIFDNTLIGPVQFAIDGTNRLRDFMAQNILFVSSIPKTASASSTEEIAIQSINDPIISMKPIENKVFVRSNKYELGRANIIIYNWQMLDSVQVDVSNIGLKSGEKYEIHNAQNYYGDVVTSIYAGGPITISMKNRVAVQSLGLSALPRDSFPEFGVFVIKKADE